jgi:hypothetical protein
MRALVSSRLLDRSEFAPFGLPDFAGSLENMGDEAQRQLRNRLPRIGFDRPQERAERHSVGDCGMMLRNRRHRRTRQGLSEID